MNIWVIFCSNLSESLKNSNFSQIILSFIGAFFGFGFSLWLYYMQNRKDKKAEFIKTKQDHVNLLLYYQELLISILKYYKNQQKLIIEFIDTQTKNFTELVPLKQNANEDFTRLKTIDNHGVFEAWVAIFNDDDIIKQYKKNNSILDYLEGTKSEISRLFFKNSDHCYSQFMEVKQIVDHIPDRLSIIAHEMANMLGDKRWEDELYIKIDAHIKQYMDLVKEGSDFKTMDSKFLDSLLDTFQKDYKDFPYSDEISLYCKKARVKLNHIEFELKNFIEELNKIIENIQEPLRELQTAVNKMDTLKR